MSLVNFTRTRARRAAKLAAALRLRGADAVYVALALEYGATLVTWDAEMLQRAPAAMLTMTPAEWLATNAAKGDDS